MATILATVDIEDLATAKIAGIKDALTDLAQTQVQIAASSAALGSQMQGAITAMGSQVTVSTQLTQSLAGLNNQMQATVATAQEQVAAAQQVVAAQTALAGSMTASVAAMDRSATVSTEAAAGMQRLAAATTAVAAAVPPAADGIGNFFESFVRSQQAIVAQADAVRATIGVLGALSVAAQQGVVPLQEQAAALAEMAAMAKEGAPGLAQYASALEAMTAQTAAGTPLTEEQSVALLQMAKSMEEANAALLDGRSAMERLTAETQATNEAIRETYQNLTLLASLLKEGAVVTQTQADALKELAAAAGEGNGFTKEQAESLRQLSTAIQAGATVTKEQAQALQRVTAEYANANKATLGFKDATEESTSALEKFNVAAGVWAAGLALLGANMFGLLKESAQLAARVETLGVVMTIVGKNAGLSALEMQVQAEMVKRLGITTQEATEAVIKFAQAELKLADAGKLARAAQDLAVVGGMNSSQAYERLIRAIQSQQVEMLRAFGVVTTSQKIFAEYAATLGKTVKELTEAEKRQAFLNRVLEEGEKAAGAYEASMNTAGKQMTSFARYVEEAKLALGESLVPVMGIAIRVASAFLQFWISLPAPIQTFITAIAAASTAMALFSAAIAGAKFLQLGEGIVAVATAIMSKFVPSMAAATASVTTFQIAAGGIILLIGAIAAGIVMWTKAQESQTAARVETVATLEAESRAFESAIAKYYDAATALNRYQGEVEALSRQFADQTDRASEYEESLRKVEAEQSKLNAARAALIRMHPELASALTGEIDTLGDLARAIDAVTAAERQRQREATTAAITAYEADERRAEEARQALRRAQDDLRKQEELQQQRQTRTMEFRGMRITSPVSDAERNRALESYRKAVDDASKTFTELNNGVAAQRPRIDALRRTLLSAAEQQVLMQTDLRMALDQWKKENADFEAKLKQAGPKFTESLLLKSKDVADLKTKLGEVDQAWAKHLLERERETKRLENLRKSVTKALTLDADDLARFGQLQTELAKVEGTDKYIDTLFRAKGMLEQFVTSAAKAVPSLASLHDHFAKLQELQATGLTPAELDAYRALNTLLSNTKGNTADYNAVLEAHAAELAKVNGMTAKQKALVTGMDEVFEGAAVALERYTDELRRAAEVKIGEEERAAARESVELFRQMNEERIAQAHAVAREVLETQIRTAEETRAINQQLADDLAEQTLEGTTLIIRQLQRQNEELRHRYEVEKAARDRALAEEKYQTAEKIRLWKEERERKAENQIRDLRDHLERMAWMVREAELKAKLSGKATDILAAERGRAELQVAEETFARQKQIIEDQLALDLAAYQKEEAALWANVAAHEQANAQIDAAHKAATDARIKRNQQLIEDQKSGLLKWRAMWASVSEAIASGVTDLLVNIEDLFKGAKTAMETFEKAMVGIWRSIQRAVFSIFEEILRKWIFNLLKMKSATQAANVAAGIADMPGEAGGGAGAAGKLPRGGLFPSNPTGSQMAQGALAGAVAGGTVGYGVGRGTGSTAAGVGAGAATGAGVGWMVGGPVGAAVGAGVGALFGWLGSRQAHKEAREMRDEYLKGWAGGLDELKEKAKEAGAELEFREVMRANTPEKVEKAIKDLEKAMALTQAKKDLAHTEDQLVSLSKQAQLVGYDLTKLYNAKTIEEFNREQEKLNKLLEEQQQRIQALGSAAQGLETWATGFQNTIGKGFQKAFPDPKAAEAFMKQYQEAVDKGFRGTFVEFAKHARLSDTVIANLEKVGAAAQDEFQSLGITAAATFAGIIRETGDITQAMNAIAPTLDKLIDAQDQWGLTADDTFASLLQFRRIIKDNEDIFQSLGGMTQALKGLSEAGALTEETFDALGRSAVEKFNTLVERTGDQRMALMSMQPTLQALWEAQKKYGFSVDESTQALIDQGVEQGIVGASMQGVNQRMLDVLGLIAQQLGVARDKLEAIGVTGDHAVDRVTDRLGEAGDAAEEAGQHFARSREEYNNLADVARRGLPPPDPEAERRYNEFRMTAKETADQLRDTGDQGRTSGDAVEGGAEAATRGLDQIVWKARQAEDALWRMGEAGQQAGYQIEMSSSWAANGRSPTGIKEITLRLKESEKAMKDFSEYFVTQAQKVEDAATDIAGQHRVDLAMDPATLGLQKVEPAVPPQTSGQSVTVQVTQEGPQISVNAIDNANMEEAWRSKIMPEYLKHIDNNADQLAERTEAAISRHRRRAS